MTLWLKTVLFNGYLKSRSDPQMTQMKADVKTRKDYAQRLSKVSECHLQWQHPMGRMGMMRGYVQRVSIDSEMRGCPNWKLKVKNKITTTSNGSLKLGILCSATRVQNVRNSMPVLPKLARKGVFGKNAISRPNSAARGCLKWGCLVSKMGMGKCGSSKVWKSREAKTLCSTRL